MTDTQPKEGGVQENKPILLSIKEFKLRSKVVGSGSDKCNIRSEHPSIPSRIVLVRPVIFIKAMDFYLLIHIERICPDFVYGIPAIGVGICLDIFLGSTLLCGNQFNVSNSFFL